MAGMENKPQERLTVGSGDADFLELQALHDSLVRAYVSIAQGTSYLNPAHPHLLTHIRQGCARLRGAYTAAALSEERSDVHDWLNERAQDLESFLRENHGSIGRFVALAKKGWSVAAAIYAALASVVAPTAAGAGLAAIVVAILSACFCKVLIYGFGVFIASLAIVGIIGFQIKHSTLASWTPDGRIDKGESSDVNIYEVEQKLLKKVNAPRHGEIQWDVVAWLLMAVALVLYRYLAPMITRHTKELVYFRYSPFYPAAVLAVLGIVTFFQSLRRPWGWRALI